MPLKAAQRKSNKWKKNTAVLQNKLGWSPVMTTWKQHCCVWHRMLSSVNSVTSIALHGLPQWCVSAAETGLHNRNPIQPFYSQEETRCIPSNNRHCLDIHILQCNKSHAPLLHGCPQILEDDSGLRYTFASLCVLFFFFLLNPYFSIRNNLKAAPKIPPSFLTCQARDSVTTPLF